VDFETMKTRQLLLREGLFMAFVVLLPFLVTQACSREEPSEPQSPQKIVMKIKKPKPQKESVSPPPPREEEKKGPSIQMVKPQETRAPEVKISDVSAQVAMRPDKAKAVPQGDEHIYIVQNGDSLEAIAARPEVYGAPLKWTSLYWCNQQALLNVIKGPEFEKGTLPTGMKLKFITQAEAEKNRASQGKALWVINLFSDKTMRRISPLAIKLIREGFHPYIVKTTIHDEPWYRLRVGFFKRPSEAKGVRERILQTTGLKQVWIAKISEKEFTEYGGY